MQNKYLVIVYVPMIEEEYEIYIPEVKKIGTVKKLIIKIIAEQSGGTFTDDNTKFLYDKKTGELLDDELFVRNSNIQNGTKLLLY